MIDPWIIHALFIIAIDVISFILSICFVIAIIRVELGIWSSLSIFAITFVLIKLIILLLVAGFQIVYLSEEEEEE